MEHPEPPPLQPRGALTTVGSTCFVPAKQTGLTTLIMQFVILLISVLTVLFFFYHVGGYEYMSWNENSTILEPIYNHGKHKQSTTTPAVVSTPTTRSYDIFELNKNDEENIRADRDILDSIDSGISQVICGNLLKKRNFQIHTLLNNTEDVIGNFTTSIEPIEPVISVLEADNDTEEIHIPDTIIHIGDAELDMLEMIRISTLAYIVLAILWLISQTLLLFSIKYEIIDMVVINAICLTAAVMYLFIHAIFIAVLLYYQRDLSFRSMAIVIGSAVILFAVVALGGFALALVVGWYKYIMYMNDGEKCYCIALCVGIIKGERHEPASRAQEYAMHEAGRNPNEMTYNEPPIQNFSSF